jgi:hypothetical protein
MCPRVCLCGEAPVKDTYMIRLTSVRSSSSAHLAPCGIISIAHSPQPIVILSGFESRNGHSVIATIIVDPINSNNMTNNNMI